MNDESNSYTIRKQHPKPQTEKTKEAKKIAEHFRQLKAEFLERDKRRQEQRAGAA